MMSMLCVPRHGSLFCQRSKFSVVCSIYGESEIFPEDRFVPIQVARSSVETGECFGGAQPLMIAAGGRDEGKFAVGVGKRTF